MTQMDAKTLEALKASIAKWERNAEAEHYEDYKTGATYCPLCLIFRHDSHQSSCRGCPVFEKTARPYCEGSPYYDAWKAWFAWRNKPLSDERRDRARAAARDEVAFLKSLLLEETP